MNLSIDGVKKVVVTEHVFPASLGLFHVIEVTVEMEDGGPRHQLNFWRNIVSTGFPELEVNRHGIKAEGE